MFDPLYQCSVCKKAVKVIAQGEGVPPKIVWDCEHTDAVIWANRKVTLRGKGQIGLVRRIVIRITGPLRAWLCRITGRNI